MFSNVDFPEPLVPMIVTNSPFATENVTPPQRVNRLAADLKVPAQILDSYDMIVHGFALIRFRGSETFVCPAAGPPV